MAEKEANALHVIAKKYTRMFLDALHTRTGIVSARTGEQSPSQADELNNENSRKESELIAQKALSYELAEEKIIPISQVTEVCVVRRYPNLMRGEAELRSEDHPLRYPANTLARIALTDIYPVFEQQWAQDCWRTVKNRLPQHLKLKTVEAAVREYGRNIALKGRIGVEPYLDDFTAESRGNWRVEAKIMGLNNAGDTKVHQVKFQIREYGAEGQRELDAGYLDKKKDVNGVFKTNPLDMPTYIIGIKKDEKVQVIGLLPDISKDPKRQGKSLSGYLQESGWQILGTVQLLDRRYGTMKADQHG